MNNLWMTVALGVKGKVQRFLYDESGEVNIVTTVVLIGIAIALAVLFRGAIEELLTTLMEGIKSGAADAVAPAEGS